MPSLPTDPRRSLPILAKRVSAARARDDAAEAQRDKVMKAAKATLGIRELSRLTGLSTARVQQITTDKPRKRRKAKA